MKPGTPFALSCLFLTLSLLTGHFAVAQSMRAAVVVDGVPKIETVPRPEPGEGQVRIKVHAASVNPVDWKVAAGASNASRMIPGRDLSGVIDAVGPSVERWKVGDPVVAVSVSGSYAEYAIASVNAIAAKPARMSFEEAAGIPVVGETAWRAVVTVADVQKGQRVLIHGGAGGVGSAAVQIAKARGAYVIATASPRNHEFLRSIGADEVIDYNTVRFEQQVKDLDMVLNTVDEDTGLRSIGVIRPGGILVSVVGAAPADRCEAARIRCAITGRVNGEMLPHVVTLADEGKLRISIQEQFPLEEAAKGWELNRKGHTRGKLILTVSGGTGATH